MRGFLVEIFILSRSKIGIEIGWVHEEGRVFRDFHPETRTFPMLWQWEIPLVNPYQYDK
jgi:hypothetical protein